MRCDEGGEARVANREVFDWATVSCYVSFEEEEEEEEEETVILCLDRLFIASFLCG